MTKTTPVVPSNQTGQNQVQGITRLPSVIKDRMVAVPRDPHATGRVGRGHLVPPRKEAKMSLVDLGSNLNMVQGQRSGGESVDRSLNEQLGKFQSRNPGMFLLAGTSTSHGISFMKDSPSERTGINNNMQHIKVNTSGSFLKSSFQMPTFDRGRTLYWPTSTTRWTVAADTRTPWLDPKLRPDANLPPLKFVHARHPFDEAYLGSWLRPHEQLARGSTSLLLKEKTNIKQWQPTLDSVLKSEALKNYNLHQKQREQLNQFSKEQE